MAGEALWRADEVLDQPLTAPTDRIPAAAIIADRVIRIIAACGSSVNVHTERLLCLCVGVLVCCSRFPSAY